MLSTVMWAKKSPMVESSTWPLNCHNFSENYTKTKNMAVLDPDKTGLQQCQILSGLKVHR